MAQNVIDWVWKHSRAVNGSLIVLLAIAHEANRDGEAEMSALELAFKCRLGERTVQVAVRELAGSGELDAEHGGGRGHRTRHRVTMRNPAESAPFRGLNPAESAPFDSGNPAESAPFPASDVFKSTGLDEVQVKETSAKPPRLDAERLCQHLADRIEANGSKRPVITKRWLDAARLMLDNDGRTEQQITSAIDWCQKNEFWRVNILSMPKLREKYDQLRLEAARATGNGRQAQTDALFGAAMDRARAKEGRK